MPSGPVEEQNSMGAVGDVARHFVEVELHHVGDLAGPHISGVVGEPRVSVI
jgi:hypothetical protein